MLGYVDIVNGIGLVRLIPGGLFEFVLPFWLFAKGFNSQALNTTGGPARASHKGAHALTPIKVQDILSRLGWARGPSC